MEKVKIKVATYNVECSPNEVFAPRLAAALKYIERDKPDIIGFQETRPGQQEMLAEALPDYDIVGYGRSADFSGESNCVAYRKDTFTLFGYHQCWLSPTPFVPGTRFEEQSSCPRVVVTVMLKHKGRDLPFRFYNTHLDHIGEQARVLGMGQILDRIKKDNADWELPLILTGDMNAKPNSVAISNAVNDSLYPLEDCAANLPITFHGFGNEPECKIDYIFVNKGCEHGDAYIWDNGVDTPVSDHYPVVCDITI